MGYILAISGNSIPPPELKCPPLGPLGNPVALLAGIDNYYRTWYPAQARECLVGERANSGTALRLPWYRYLAI